MNKKIIICICIAIILMGILVGVIIYRTDEPKNELDIEAKMKQKGYELLGSDYCMTDHSFEVGGDALTEWECKLCGVSAINPTTNVPKLCRNCAQITGRCYQCGKVKNMKTITNINVVINDKKYNARIENNETAQTFVSSLPQEFNMKELNGNEKYIYMDNSLPTNPSNPEHIEAGDIMLYGNDCLVIFYKSFDTNYRYTRIGHIDNLSDLGSDRIIAKFEK